MNTESKTPSIEARNNARRRLQENHLSQRIDLARQLLAIGPLPDDLIALATNIPNIQDARAVHQHGSLGDGLVLQCATFETLRLACQAFLSASAEEDDNTVALGTTRV